jgi:NTP pyrophosphatase (non-canonical NTP hydrolase)
MRRVDIIMPRAGESVTEADIARWCKKDGDRVEEDETILEFETDKASLEICAPATGILKIVEEEGATVPVLSVVGHIELLQREVGYSVPPDSVHFNKLTPAEAERLAILGEECGEVVQAIGKILRHGYESRHPDGGLTNREQLELELGDVLCLGRIMGVAGDISMQAVETRCAVKPAKLVRYTHHQGEGND